MFAHGMGFEFGHFFLSLLHPAFLLVDRLLSLSFHWGSCLATGGGLFRFHVPTVRHLGCWLPTLTLGNLPYPRSLGLPRDPLPLVGAAFHLVS